MVALVCSREPSEEFAKELEPLIQKVLGLSHQMLQLSAASSDKKVEQTVKYGQAVAVCFSKITLRPELDRCASIVAKGKHILSKDVALLLDKGFGIVMKAFSELHVSGFLEIKDVAIFVADAEYLRYEEIVKAIHGQVAID